MIKNITRFFRESRQADPLAFYFEMTGSFCAIVASGILAALADNPPMIIIYPFYLASSVLHFISSIRRNAAWIAALSAYFTLINIYGILNLTVF